MRLLFYLLPLLFSVLSCQHSPQEKETKTPAFSQPNKHNSLKVATLPTLTAIPLYYAVMSGITDSLGLSLDLTIIAATIDGEERLQKRTTDIVLSDAVRALYHHARRQERRWVASVQETAGIVTAQRLRLRKLSQLEERTLGVPRFCALDLVREQAQIAAKLPYDRVLPAQINSLYLRTQMLDEGQIEAAALPEPFLSIAQQAGHLAVTPSKGLSYTACWITTDSILQTKEERLQKFVTAYNLAVQRLNKASQRIDFSAITQALQLSPEATEVMKKHRYAPLTAPQKKDLESSMSYLIRRANSKKYDTSKLPTTRFF